LEGKIAEKIRSRLPHPKTNKFLGDNIIPDVDRSDNIINVEK